MSHISHRDIPPALTGKELLEAFAKRKEARKPLADGFLYEKTLNMIYSDAGLGKSTIMTQMCMELAAGIPLWGFFEVLRPLKVLYIQGERDILETLERLDLYRKTIPLNENNLIVTDEYQRFNLLNPQHSEMFIECIKRDCPDADVVAIDPIYSMVAGGLKDDIPASAFTKAMSNVQQQIGATMIYGHHIVKPQYHGGEMVERQDPFYGSTWLKAHCTAMIHMKKHEVGVQLVTKKDNYSLLPEKVVLEYDGETGLVSVPTSELPAIDRVRNFIRIQGELGKEYTFKDIENGAKLCTRRLREVLMHSSIEGMISVVSTKKNKKLYKTRTRNSSSAVH